MLNYVFSCWRLRKIQKILINISVLFIIGYLFLYNLDSSSRIILSTKENAVLTPISEYEKMYVPSMERPTSGNYPGYLGAPVIITKPYDFDTHKFNLNATESIPWLRELPEARNTGCLNSLYIKKMKKVSIIMVFLNEAWSTLMRTIHTIISRSPKHLLAEIIIVDDGSDLKTFPHLADKLEKELEKFNFIRLIRHKENIGLVEARLTGTRIAKGDIFVFMDSHCEVFNGWLEPLVHLVTLDSTVVATPTMEAISNQDFSVLTGVKNIINVGVFNWNLDFDWKAQANKNYVDAFDSPTMAGGIFAIDRNFYFQIGAYDNQFKQWGSENLEISFRIWSCGGSIKLHPCSVIGHVFRETTPHKLKTQTLQTNKLRIAHIWLDEYKKIFFRRYPSLSEASPPDVTDMLKLRQKLNCKSFKWYLTDVLKIKYLPDIEPRATGQLKVVGSTDCIDSMGQLKDNQQVVVFGCQKSDNQIMEFMSDGLIVHGDFALGLSDNKELVWKTIESVENGIKWEHNKNNSIICKSINKCLAVNDKSVILEECDSKNSNQLFLFQFYN